MEDSRIVALYWDRDARAIEWSRRKYGPYCFSVANHILNSYEDAEECVNDTWLGAWNAMPPHRPDNLRMFLAKIARSLAFDRFKANSALKRGGGQMILALEELSECLPDGTDIESTVMAEELGESIRGFVRGLSVREGDIFSRRYFFTESLEDIAAGYGLTVNNTAVILSRIRRKLKEHLIREGYI